MYILQSGDLGLKATASDGNVRIYAGSAGNERMRIASNGNVGIGTTSPDANLDIGVNNIITLDDTGSSTGFIGLGSYNDGTKNRAQGASYYGFGLEIDRPNALISFNSYDSNGATTTGENTLVLKRDGNVGIGTASPLTKLHIAGTTNNNIIRIENTSTALSSGSTIGAIQFFNNDTSDDSPNVAASIYATAGASGGSGSLRFKTTEPGTEGDPATDTMIITNGGRVGIGTTSPSSLLHLESESSPALQIKDTTNNVTFKAYAQNSNTHLANSSNHDLFIDTNNISRIAVKASGNVGIGTTNPTQPFQVDAGSNIASFRSVGTGENNKELLIQTGGDRVTLDAKNADDGTATSLAFELGNSEKARLTTTGLGIGTTSPSTRLEVSSSGANGILISKDPNSTSNSGRLFFETDTVSEGFSFLNSNGLMTIRSQAQAGATSGNVRVAIDSSGNVGIGTTSPEVALHIDSTDLGQTENDTTTQAIFSTRNSNASKLYIQDYRTAGGNSWTSSGKRIQEKIDSTWMGYMQFNGDSNNGGISFGTGNNTTQGNVGERMRITSVGDVGIGTTSPVAKLDVRGNAAFIGGNEITTNLYVHATNTAGSPARTACIDMQGYEGRAIGTFLKMLVILPGLFKNGLLGLIMLETSQDIQ